MRLLITITIWLLLACISHAVAVGNQDTVAVPDEASVKRLVLAKVRPDDEEKVITSRRAVRRLLAFLNARRTGWKPNPPSSTCGSGPASGPWPRRTRAATWCWTPTAPRTGLP